MGFICFGCRPAAPGSEPDEGVKFTPRAAHAKKTKKKPTTAWASITVPSLVVSPGADQRGESYDLEMPTNLPAPLDL